MIVLVEGIDRVGKTTFIDKLAKVTGYPTFKDDTRYAMHHDDMLINSEKMNTLMNVIERRLVYDAIFDRFHWTEMVYGLVDRSYVNKGMDDIEERLKKYSYDTCNVCMVYVEPTDIMWSSKEHGKSLMSHHMLYEKLYEKLEIPKFKCNHETIDEAITQVTEFISKTEGMFDELQ